MSLDEIIQEIYNFFQLKESIDRKRFKNSLYTDTYYDDEENSLLKSGGSLKLRDSVDNIGIRKQTFIDIKCTLLLKSSVATLRLG